jgi:hypothetical protein
MGLSLIEAAKHETRVERLAVIKTFTEGQLISRLPFRNLLGGALKFAVEKKMPRVGFRAVNEGYRRDYGAVENDTEFVHLFGGDLDVDRSIVDLNGPEARASQTEQKVRSMRLTLEAAAGRCTPRRSRGTLKDGRRRPEHLVSAARLCSVTPPAKWDALLCDSAKLVLCLAELLVRDASQMYPCRKDASESQRRAIDMGSLPPLSSSHTPSASL